MTTVADRLAAEQLQAVSSPLVRLRTASGRSVFAALWAVLALVLTLSGAPIPSPAASNSFGLYLPAETVPAQVLLQGTKDLSRIKLTAAPVISEADIVAYDFAQHVMKLQSGAIVRVLRLLTNRPYSAFVAVANGAPAYLGVFSRFDSLEPFEVPVIITDWRYEEQPSDTFAITWPFPPGVAPGNREDPRDNERIKAALTPLDKLQRLGVPYQSVVTRKLTITNAVPSKMAHFLSKQFMESDSGGSTNKTRADARGRSGPRQPGLVLLVADARTRAVMVSAPRERILPIAVIIRALDGVPSPPVWPDGTLGPDEARDLAAQLANAKAQTTFGTKPFQGGPDPTWAGRWFWQDVKGDIQALVSFEANGSNQVVAVTRDREQERKPARGF